MRKIEVLRVRVTDGSRIGILQDLRSEWEAMKRCQGVERVELFLNEILESDIAVHVYWKPGALLSEKSELAAVITGGLRDRCIVHHTTWIEGGNNDE